jgi:hypothetical protein
MTIKLLATMLCTKEGSARDAARMVIVPNAIFCDATEKLLEVAFKDVDRLRRQRNELVLLMPDQVEQWKRDFNEAVMTVARELQSALEVEP